MNLYPILRVLIMLMWHYRLSKISLMNRRFAVSTIAGAAIGAAQTRTPKVGLAGTWRLVSCVRTHQDGTTSFPWGEYPVGQIIYLSSGRMSAQIMRPGRTSTVPPGVDYGSSKATDYEIRCERVRVLLWHLLDR